MMSLYFQKLKRSTFNILTVFFNVLDVSQEKLKFFKKNVEYLGVVVARGGIKTSLEKVRAIQSKPPTSLYG